MDYPDFWRRTKQTEKNAVRFGLDILLDAGGAANFGFFDKFTVAAWIRPLTANGTVLAKMTAEFEERPYVPQDKLSDVWEDALGDILDDGE